MLTKLTTSSCALALATTTGYDIVWLLMPPETKHVPNVIRQLETSEPVKAVLAIAGSPRTTAVQTKHISAIFLVIRQCTSSVMALRTLARKQH
jgi:hypothetical protein